MKILVVDDEPTVINLHTKMFVKLAQILGEGWEVITATSKEDALAKIKDFGQDEGFYVVTDREMPAPDGALNSRAGIELLQAVKSDPRFLGATMITGIDEDELHRVKIELSDAGINFKQKSKFDWGELLKSIECEIENPVVKVR